VGKAIIFSAPSGSGKSTLVRYIMRDIPGLEFSISATSRAPRGIEENGREYYFISREEFMEKVSRDELFEWQEVYGGTCYGTLRSELERIWNKGNVVIFDVDVQGGINIKKMLCDDVLSIFVKVPSLDVLKKRLISRGTDSEESIAKRLEKASIEMTFEGKFDKVVVNDNLELAIEKAEKIIKEFLKK